MGKGQHTPQTLNSRTMPAEYSHIKIPAGQRAVACTADGCGAVYTARTADELDRVFAEHVAHIDALGEGTRILHDEVKVHVPVLHGEKVAWCEGDREHGGVGHRNVITEDTEPRAACSECGARLVRVEDSPVFRDTIIMPLDEWLAKPEDERQRWVTEEGHRRIKAHLDFMEAERNKPEPTHEEQVAIHEAGAARAEAEALQARAHIAELAARKAEAAVPAES